MNAVLPTVTSSLRTAYAAGTHLVLLFDYDGTLVPIVDDPRHARLSSQTRGTLEQLANLPRVDLGIISGRQHLDLKEMISIPGLFLAGTAGLELDFRGITVTHPKVAAALPHLQSVAVKLNRLADQFPGVWIESKRAGITLHYRHVAGSHVSALLDLADAILSPQRCGLRVVEGPLALEITPNVGWTKGSAVRMFLQSIPAKSCSVLYAGDSPNDLDAIEAVADLGGMTIGVGIDAPPRAHVRVASPQVLCEWLLCLTRSLSQIAHDKPRVR